MTIKQLVKIEDAASEVWVVSPALHYDIDNNDFSEIVSVNRGENIKYRYIVPANSTIERNLKSYKKKYNLSDTDIDQQFLLLPECEFVAFVLETAIYNGSTQPSAYAAPALENNNEVIQFSNESAIEMAKSFKATWKKYKRKSL